MKRSKQAVCAAYAWLVVSGSMMAFNFRADVPLICSAIYFAAALIIREIEA